MYKIVCVLALLAHQATAVSTSGTTVTKCGANEIFLKCGPRCPQKCDVRARECKPTGVCNCQGCYCVDGYVRYNGICKDENKVCCPKNEIFACGSACQTECSTLGQDCPIKTLVCVENCFCVEGYARDSNGKCIPVSQCPTVITCTKANEHYEQRAIKIEPSCDNRSGYQGKCVCNVGYIRDKNKNCIKVSECSTSPPSGNSGCKRNESYQMCGNPCQGTCDNPDRPLTCKIACRPGCFCKAGYLLNEINNKCVKPYTCDIN